jgi:hypothetical protein
MSTALAVALILLLTPCCEVFAALATAAVPAHTGTLHTHHDDGDTPPAGEHCAPWLDQAFIPVGTAALPAPPGIDAPLPYQQSAVQYPRATSIVPHAGAPPPARAVYLLTSRFLL